MNLPLSEESLKEMADYWRSRIAVPQNPVPPPIDDIQEESSKARLHVPLLLNELKRLHRLLTGRNLQLACIVHEAGGSLRIKAKTQTVVDLKARLYEEEDKETGDYLIRIKV